MASLFDILTYLIQFLFSLFWQTRVLGVIEDFFRLNDQRNDFGL